MIADHLRASYFASHTDSSTLFLMTIVMQARDRMPRRIRLAKMHLQLPRGQHH